MPNLVSTDNATDRWLRSHQPRTELALRCSMRGQFEAAKNSAPFNARIDELYAAINPNEDQYAAILRHAREIGFALGKLLDR